MPGRSGTRHAPHPLTSQAGSTPDTTDLPRGPRRSVPVDSVRMARVPRMFETWFGAHQSRVPFV
jgi:hypothetical protein